MGILVPMSTMKGRSYISASYISILFMSLNYLQSIPGDTQHRYVLPNTFHFPPGCTQAYF
jgi:hypothetical protein